MNTPEIELYLSNRCESCILVLEYIRYLTRFIKEKAR
jgi:hypothetical protein